MNISLDVRRKLSNIIFELDFYGRDQTEDFLDEVGAIGPSVYLAVLCWCAMESDDLCFRESQIRRVAKKLRLKNDDVKRVLDAACLENIALLRYSEENQCWYSRRLFKEAVKFARKQSNPKLAEKVEHYLSRLLGTERNSADTSGTERKEAEESGGSRAGIGTGIGIGSGIGTGEAEDADGSGLIFPPTLDTPEHRAAFQVLVAHKSRIGKPFRTLQAQNTTLCRWSARPSEFREAVAICVACEWKDLVWDRDYATTRPGSAKPPNPKPRAGSDPTPREPDKPLTPEQLERLEANYKRFGLDMSKFNSLVSRQSTTMEVRSDSTMG